MKTSKKIFALAMSFVMLLGLTACGSRPATVATTASATEAATQPSEAADQTAAATEAASAKTLVVYPPPARPSFPSPPLPPPAWARAGPCLLIWRAAASDSRPSASPPACLTRTYRNGSAVWACKKAVRDFPRKAEFSRNNKGTSE